MMERYSLIINNDYQHNGPFICRLKYFIDITNLGVYVLSEYLNEAAGRYRIGSLSKNIESLLDVI